MLFKRTIQKIVIQIDGQKNTLEHTRGLRNAFAFIMKLLKITRMEEY